jgi:hypothetical protein
VRSFSIIEVPRSALQAISSGPGTDGCPGYKIRATALVCGCSRKGVPEEGPDKASPPHVLALGRRRRRFAGHVPHRERASLSVAGRCACSSVFPPPGGPNDIRARLVGQWRRRNRNRTSANLVEARIRSLGQRIVSMPCATLRCRTWHLIPSAAVQNAPPRLFVHAAPLLEVKGNALFHASISDCPHPSNWHRPSTMTAFTASDDPINSTKVVRLNWTEQGFETQKAHLGIRASKVVNPRPVILALHTNSHPNVRGPSQAWI